MEGVSSRLKRRIEDQIFSDSDEGAVGSHGNTKIPAREFASVGIPSDTTTSKSSSSQDRDRPMEHSITSSASSSTPVLSGGSSVEADPINNMNIIISGRDRVMTRYHPGKVNRAISSVIDSYAGIKPLPSGDLLLTCYNHKQVTKILGCDSISDTSQILVSLSKLHLTLRRNHTQVAPLLRGYLWKYRRANCWKICRSVASCA